MSVFAISVDTIYSWVCNFADFRIFGVSQTSSLVSTPKILKNHESHTAIISIAIRAICAILCHCEICIANQSNPNKFLRNPK